MGHLCKLNILLLAAVVLTLAAESSSAAAAAATLCADTCTKCKEVCDTVGAGQGYNCQTMSATNSAVKICRCNTNPHTIIPQCKGSPGAAPSVMNQGILLGGICLTTALMNLHL